MKHVRSFAVGGVLLIAGSLTSSALAKAMEAAGKTQISESISAIRFQHCDVHTEDTVPRPESRIDVNVPSITGAQTVDVSHSIDANTVALQHPIRLNLPIPRTHFFYFF